jgi:hypothetical protein
LKTAGTGENNTASGAEALYSNTTGSDNTASGYQALYSNTKGSYNIALGYLAGYYAPDGKETETTGSSNIYIGANVSPGSAAESNTIRMGNGQTATYIAGIADYKVGSGSTVYINAKGRLGIAASSRLYKKDIEDMGDASSGLMKLRPVTFHYKAEYADGPRTTQYGLIAEEVAEVYPDLVQYDPETGEPQTVCYHLVNAMLLNEVQKQQKEITSLEEQASVQNRALSALKEEASALREQVKDQGLELSALKERDKELSALKEQIKELSALVENGRKSTERLSKLEDRLVK